MNPPASITDLSDMGSVVIPGYIHTFAVLLQYIFPMIFLVAAVVSFAKRSRSIMLFDDVRGGPKAEIANLSWQEFEALVGEGFRHRGFEVAERGGAAPDGGVDLVLARGQNAGRQDWVNGGPSQEVNGESSWPGSGHAELLLVGFACRGSPGIEGWFTCN